MPSAMGRLDDLLALYARLWQMTQVVRAATVARQVARLRGPKMDQAKEAKLRRMSLFCRQRGLDARRWVFALFEARRWVQPPPFDALCAPEALSVYADGRRMAAYERLEREAEDRREQARDRAQRAQALAPGAEALKASYARAGLSEVCLEDQARTRGYHPKSAWCARCACARACWDAYRATHDAGAVGLRLGASA